MKNNIDVKSKFQNLLVAISNAKNIVDDSEKVLFDIENKKKQIENDLKQILDKKVKELTEIRENKESFDKYKEKELDIIKQERNKLFQLQSKVEQDLISSKKSKDEAEALLNSATIKNKELDKLISEYQSKISEFKSFVSKQQS